MSMDLTNFAPFHKTLFPDIRVESQAVLECPLLGMMPKEAGYTGKQETWPVQYEDLQNSSATYSVAETDFSDVKGDDFTAARKRHYTHFFLDAETMASSEANEGAFVEAVEMVTNSAINVHGKRQSAFLFGDGLGGLGNIGTSTLTGSTVTLTDPDQIVNFAVGMRISFFTGTTLRDSGAHLTIATVSRANGTFTTTANLNTITGIAANDDICAKGDHNAVAMGLSGYLPLLDPGATAFLGVDRSVDPWRLGGGRFDGRGLAVEEAGIKGLTLYQRENGFAAKPDVWVMGTDTYAQLLVGAQGKMVYTPTARAASNKVQVSYEGIKLVTPRGPIDVIPDPFCTRDRSYLLKLDTWKIRHLKQLPHIAMDDGLRTIRQASADGQRGYVRSWWNTRCIAPGRNLVIRHA